MNEAVTFLVKATSDRNKIIRCLNSVYRQTNKSFKVIAFCSIRDMIPKIKDSYPEIKVIKMKNSKEFVEKLNNEFKNVETEFCAFVNFDEIIVPNAVDMILSKNADAAVFNISKKNKKQKFVPRFKAYAELTPVYLIKKGQLIWNNAIRSKIIKENAIKLQEYSPALQMLFLLECYSFADRIATDYSVIGYKDSFASKELPNYEQFERNCKTIGKIINRFEKKGMYDVKERIVTDFVVSQLSSYYNEKSFFERRKKKRLLRRYMGL